MTAILVQRVIEFARLRGADTLDRRIFWLTLLVGIVLPWATAAVVVDLPWRGPEDPDALSWSRLLSSYSIVLVPLGLYWALPYVALSLLWRLACSRASLWGTTLWERRVVVLSGLLIGSASAVKFFASVALFSQSAPLYLLLSAVRMHWVASMVGGLLTGLALVIPGWLSRLGVPARERWLYALLTVTALVVLEFGPRLVTHPLGGLLSYAPLAVALALLGQAVAQRL